MPPPEAPLAGLPPSSQWSRLRAESLRLAVLRQERPEPERPQRPAGMEQRLSQLLPVGLKGLEAWDELLLPAVGEREAIAAVREAW